jgi:ribosomal protein S3AE
MAEKKESKDVKIKKKKWLPIYAPSLFGNNVIGETLVSSSEELMGKPLVANVMALTGEMKKQHINVKFKVMSVKDNAGVADLIGYQVSPSSIRRIVRRRHERIDDSVLYVTKDNKYMRIKTLFITKSKTKRSVTTKLKRYSQRILVGFIKERSYLDAVRAILTGELQDTAKRALSKIYPLRICDVRVMALEKAPKTAFGESVAPAADAEALQKEDAADADEKSGSSETADLGKKE